MSSLLSSPQPTPLSSPGLRRCAAVPPRLPGCRHARRIGGTTRRDREAFAPRRTASARSGGHEPLWSRPYYSVGTASATSARAALAQSTSFCTVGAPLSPIAPTTSPFTLMGTPPPHAATRASVGIPAKSDGSPWIKLKKSCVETPNRAVYAFFCAISMVGTEAPSIRLKALRLPPSSRIATFSLTPISLAFATALSTIFCASSKEMLCFFTTLAIRHHPPVDLYCLPCPAESHCPDGRSRFVVG